MSQRKKRPRLDDCQNHQQQQKEQFQRKINQYAGYCIPNCPNDDDDNGVKSNMPIPVPTIHIHGYNDHFHQDDGGDEGGQRTQQKQQQKQQQQQTLPDPSKFFHEYIAKRKPCLLKNALHAKSQDNDGSQSFSSCNEFQRLKRFQSLEYLQQKAGSATVHVELRPSPTSPFGQSRSPDSSATTATTNQNNDQPQPQPQPQNREIALPFQTLLSKIQSSAPDATLHYLTTQPLSIDDEGRPAILSSPLTHLTDDFVLRPPLAGNLIPMNCNLWLGAATGGSTSGMHHDYHDNFYCLIQGKKRFVLHSPDRAEAMGTRGDVVCVYPNGRIVYREDCGMEDGIDGGVVVTIGADGAEDAAVEAMVVERRKDAAEKELVEAEAAVERGEDGAEERLERAEEELQVALDAVLDAEMGGEDEDEDEDEKEAGDVWKDIFRKKGIDGDDSEGQEFGLNDDINDDDELDDEGDQEQEDEEDGRQRDETSEKMNNFCIVNKRDPNLPYMEVTVDAGDILYLPAGWFHEVTSYSSSSSHYSNGNRGDNEKVRNDSNQQEQRNEDNEKHCSFHLAFNYWFHPPDSQDFDSPYTRDFWQRDWDARMGLDGK